MLLLTSTSDQLNLVTGSAVSDIYVQIAWIDLNGTQLFPGRTNTIITTETTTNILASPASSYQRALKNLCIFNSSGSSCQVTLQHTDGTNVVDIFNYTMLTGEAIYWSEGRGFYVQDANGNFKTSIQGTSGTVNSGTAGQVAYYASSGTVISGDGLLTDNGSVLSYTGTSGLSAPALTINGGVKLTSESGNSPIITTADSSVKSGPSGDIVTLDGAGNVQDSGVNISTVNKPAGNNGDIQYNNNGTLAGSPATTDSSGDLTLPLSAILTVANILVPNPNTGIVPLFINFNTFGGAYSPELILKQNSVATAYENNAPPSIELLGDFWTGLASASEEWSIFPTLGSGAEPSSALKIIHTGTSGATTIDFTNLGGTGGLGSVLLEAYAPTQSPYSNNQLLATTAYVDSYFSSPYLCEIRDDFLGQINLTPSTSAGTTVLASDTNWTAQSIVSAGTISSASSGSADNLFKNPGQCALATVATSGDGVVIYKNQGTTVASFGALGSNAPWRADYIFCLGNSNPASYCFRVGMVKGGQQAASPPTDGMWFEFDTSNASSDTYITCVTANTSSLNYVASTVTPSTDTFYHLTIQSTVAGTILFYINGVLVASVSTDVTTATCGPFFQILTRTSSQAIMIVDFFSYVATTGRN